MDDPEVWRWIWLVAAVVFLVGEMLIVGSFFLVPFAVGAAVACLLAFLDVGAGGQWVAFVAASAAAFGGFYPLRRHLDRDPPADGIGARRLMGQAGKVIETVPAGQHESGVVIVGREEWRAESVDGSAIPEGTPVKVVTVRGTRLIVHPLQRLPE